MKLIFAILFAALLSLASPSQSFARDQIRIVGSSTVYPFITTVAEQLGRNTDLKTPIVESTGTGGGFKLFCAGVGDGHPDIANASRKIKPNELLNCYKNQVLDIREIKFGFDGIVLANSIDSQLYHLTVSDIFLALARKVPAKENERQLVDNYYKTWNDINPKLPKENIEIYGPPPTSGTRDAFVELVMEAGCWYLEGFKLNYPNLNERKKACHLIREDGVFIESGENDNLIVQKLKTNKKALGIFGYSFLEQNTNIVQGSYISGIAPTYESISTGEYTVSRPLFAYIKGAHLNEVPGLADFTKELVSDEAIAPFGYLESKGLIPLPEAEREAVQSEVLQGKNLENLAEEEESANLQLLKDNIQKLQPASGSPSN